MQDRKRDTDVQNRLLDSMGEGEGGMIWENSIETCILSSVKQIANPGLTHETGCSGLVHWEDPEGWDGEGGERGFRMGTHVNPWLIHVKVWQKPLQYCKVINLQLIKKKKSYFLCLIVMHSLLLCPPPPPHVLKHRNIFSVIEICIPDLCTQPSPSLSC